MHRPSHFRSRSLVALAALLLLLALPLSATWKGTVVDKEGVAHVMNPATSMKPAETLEAKEVWRVGGEDDEVLFGVITDIIADQEGNFYMLDSQLKEIQVYTPDGEHLRTIGREGEGPGEFRMAFNLLLLPNGNIAVLNTFPSALVGLTPDGEPADAFELPASEETGFRVLFMAQNAGDDLAVVYGFNQPSEDGFTQTSMLSLFDADASNERKLYSQASKMGAANPVIAEKEWDTFRNRWSAGPDGRVYSGVDHGQYAISVWGKDGKLQQVIHRDYPEHPRTKEQSERVMEIYKGFTRQIPIPNIQYEIEPNWNPIQTLWARDDGTVWVLTSRGNQEQPEGVIGQFDVFDENGHFARQVKLEGQGNPRQDGMFFVKDRLFVVTDWLNAMMALQGGAGAGGDMDEDAEPMEIISYKVP